MKFRKKPVVIEAVQWNGGDATQIMRWAGGSTITQRSDSPPDVLLIATPEGEMRADAGDWIIRGVKGEFYPVKDQIFRLTYEPAE